MTRNIPAKGEPPLPAYLLISNELRSRIRQGEFHPHQAVPPERELCLQYGVSRMTARRALGVLESEGLVYKGGTRGTFVAEPKIELRLGSFSHEISKSGRQPGAELYWAEQRPSEPAQAAALGLVEGEPIYAIQRLRSSDGEPLALETTYYPANLAPGLLEGDLSGSLWQVLEENFGVVPHHSVANLEVVALNETASQRLRARQASSGLRLVRRTYDSTGRCIEYAEDIYRADRVSLVIDRVINQG